MEDPDRPHCHHVCVPYGIMPWFDQLLEFDDCCDGSHAGTSFEGGYGECLVKHDAKCILVRGDGDFAIVHGSTKRQPFRHHDSDHDTRAVARSYKKWFEEVGKLKHPQCFIIDSTMIENGIGIHPYQGAKKSAGKAARAPPMFSSAKSALAANQKKLQPVPKTQQALRRAPRNPENINSRGFADHPNTGGQDATAYSSPISRMSKSSCGPSEVQPYISTTIPAFQPSFHNVLAQGSWDRFAVQSSHNQTATKKLFGHPNERQSIYDTDRFLPRPSPLAHCCETIPSTNQKSTDHVANQSGVGSMYVPQAMSSKVVCNYEMPKEWSSSKPTSTTKQKPTKIKSSMKQHPLTTRSDPFLRSRVPIPESSRGKVDVPEAERVATPGKKHGAKRDLTAPATQIDNIKKSISLAPILCSAETKMMENMNGSTVPQPFSDIPWYVSPMSQLEKAVKLQGQKDKGSGTIPTIHPADNRPIYVAANGTEQHLRQKPVVSSVPEKGKRQKMVHASQAQPTAAAATTATAAATTTVATVATAAAAAAAAAATAAAATATAATAATALKVDNDKENKQATTSDLEDKVPVIDKQLTKAKDSSVESLLDVEAELEEMKADEEWDVVDSGAHTPAYVSQQEQEARCTLM